MTQSGAQTRGLCTSFFGRTGKSLLQVHDGGGREEEERVWWAKASVPTCLPAPGSSPPHLLPHSGLTLTLAWSRRGLGSLGLRKGAGVYQQRRAPQDKPCMCRGPGAEGNRHAWVGEKPGFVAGDGALGLGGGQ